MLVITNKNLLKDYTKLSDKENEIKNFRLYYKGNQTNLIWYDGKIVYIPKEFFVLKNLINVDTNKKYKCVIYAYDMHLIQELKGKNVNFLLEENLKDLIRRLEVDSFIPLSDDVGIESLYDIDYSQIIEPIYLGKGSWLNINE